MSAGRAAAFLDRDGVINIDHGYVHRWEDFEFVPGAVEAMRRLSQAGYALVVVTNQSGIARGYYSEENYNALTRRMQADLEQHGVQLAGVFHCPHHPAGRDPALAIDCHCRKPQPGLLLQAMARLGLDPRQSFMVGDKLSDVQAARGAGLARAYLVSGKDGPDEVAEPGAMPDGLFNDLAGCVRHVLGA